MDLAKGVSDFPPEVQLIREGLIQTITQSFRRFGFAPFSSPIIHRTDTLLFKFSGDEDVVKELFRFSDQGDRELGLRFDLTVPLARFVSEHKDLKFPFKRYEIGRVYRDGPIKLGRYREFWQCDADIVGSSEMIADAECIKLASDVLGTLPFGYTIKVNNRRLLSEILTFLDIKDQAKTLIVLDKLDKIGRDAVLEQISQLSSPQQASKLLGLVCTNGTDQGRLSLIEQTIGSSQGISELREVLSMLEDHAHVEFDPSLARGLNYYTGTIYEGFLHDCEITSSVCGGGRYDEMIGQMRGGDTVIPAVGVSFGIAPLTDALLVEKHRFDRTPTAVFVIPIKETSKAASIADKLRLKGINTDVDVMNRSLSKNLDYASKLGIPYVVIVGTRDLEDGFVTVRNMRSGDEERVSLPSLVHFDFSFADKV